MDDKERRITMLEAEIPHIQEDTREIRESLAGIRSDNKEFIGRVDSKLDTFIQRIDDRFENLPKKYAAKWVEKAMVGLIALIVTPVIVAIVSVVVAEANAPDKAGTHEKR